jgi:hypothetical protein
MVRAGGPRNLEGGKAYLKDSWGARKDHLRDDDLLTLKNGSDYGHVLVELRETANAKNVFTDVWTASFKKLRRLSDENERETLCKYGPQLASFLEKLLEEQDSTEILELVTRVFKELPPFMKTTPPTAETNRLRMKLGKYLFKMGNDPEASKQLKEAWDERNRVGANDSDSEALCETGYYLYRLWVQEPRTKIRKSNMKIAEPVIEEVIDLAENNLGRRKAPLKYYKAKEKIRVLTQRRR